MFCKTHLLRAMPKFWNYIKYRCLPRRIMTSVRRYAPQICTIILTPRCNLNCGYCNVVKILHEGRDNSDANEANLDRIKHIFTNPLFANCLLVDLSGGEPLLIKDLNEIVSYLAKRGHIVNIITNGLLLLDGIAGLKKAGVSRINVSLYDANWPVIKRDIIKINRIFPVHMSMVLTRSKVEKEPDKLLDIVRFIRDAGCRSLRFWMYRPMGLNPKQEEIISDTLPAYIEFHRRIEEILPDFCLWPAVIQTKNIKKLCPQLWQRIGCDMLGNVIPCCGIDTTLSGPNSNLFNNETDAVFNHPLLVAMRENLLNSESEPPDVCKTCNLLGDPGW